MCLITTITAVAAISATSAMVGIVITTTAITSLVNIIRVLGLASRAWGITASRAGSTWGVGVKGVTPTRRNGPKT